MGEMAKLAARYPNFKSSEGTWEAYWEDLHFIPRRFLLDGLIECRMTCKFFPSVAEIIQASVGGHFSITPSDSRRAATVADIIKIYRERYDLVQLAVSARRPELKDKR